MPGTCAHPGTSMLGKVMADAVRINGAAAVASNMLLTAVVAVLIFAPEYTKGTLLADLLVDDGFCPGVARELGVIPFWIFYGPTFIGVIGCCCFITMADAYVHTDWLPVRIRYKGRPDAPRYDWNRMQTGAGISLFNMCCVYTWPKALVYWPLAARVTGFCDADRTLAAYGTEDIPFILAQIAACIFLTDMWFYFTHKMMHRPWLYSRVHKFHHEFVEADSFSFSYCHWLECFIVNEPSTMLGPLVLGWPRELAQIWMIFSSCNSVFSHSGWHLPGPVSGDPHDYHHRWRNVDFGAGGCVAAYPPSLP